jgi:carbon storage regulator CsrA
MFSPSSSHRLERSLAVLVLTRRVHEQIVLPRLNITIRVVAFQPGKVRLGIEAPADVSIMREELCGPAAKAPCRRGPPETQLAAS